MEVKFDRPVRRVNEQAVFRYVHNALIKLWKESIRAFVREAVKHIHIDTGMSYASLMPLAAQVRLREEVGSALALTNPAKAGFKNLTGQFASNNARFKSKTFGEQLGREAFDIKFGTDKSPNLSFQFHIVVFQHFLHDEPRYQYSGNWQSMSQARTAFLETFNTGIQNNEYLRGDYIVALLMELRGFVVPASVFVTERV